MDLTSNGEPALQGGRIGWMGQLLIMDSLFILGGRLCLAEASDKLKGECHHHRHHKVLQQVAIRRVKGRRWIDSTLVESNIEWNGRKEVVVTVTVTVIEIEEDGGQVFFRCIRTAWYISTFPSYVQRWSSEFWGSESSGQIMRMTSREEGTILVMRIYVRTCMST